MTKGYFDTRRELFSKYNDGLWFYPEFKVIREKK